MWNVHAKNEILLAFPQQERCQLTYVCISPLSVCVFDIRVSRHASFVYLWCQDNHLESMHCHFMQLRQTDRYTMSADRQTDLGTAVYKCEYSIYSEVHERIFQSVGICERGSRHGDGQRQL